MRALSSIALIASWNPSDYGIIDIVDIALASAICLLLLVVCIIYFKKKLLISTFLFGFSLLIVSIVFKMYMTTIVVSLVITAFAILALFFNMGPIREAMQNPLGHKGKVSDKPTIGESVPFDEKRFYNDVTTAVLKLSSTKTGAIMTFEKKMPLDSFMRNGTIINAPFTPELVETIFYVGTRLHDGAIIVRKNIIVAASVYYTPSTKALTGKFGARHRAALGISEATDSVTVVCSEETGRISIAYQGRLEPVRRDEFPTVFKDYMNY